MSSFNTACAAKMIKETIGSYNSKYDNVQGDGIVVSTNLLGNIRRSFWWLGLVIPIGILILLCILWELGIL